MLLWMVFIEGWSKGQFNGRIMAFWGRESQKMLMDEKFQVVDPRILRDNRLLRWSHCRLTSADVTVSLTFFTSSPFVLSGMSFLKIQYMCFY